MISSETLKAQHLEIKDAVEKFIAEEIKAIDLKHITSGFGIYGTRDGNFMNRIRQVGGEFSLNKLKVIADLMKKHLVPFSHISTRDSIQLHGVPAQSIYNIIRTCTENDMPFKGGGGNTYRNPLISPLSGISKKSIFDVRPYAIQTDLYVQGIENAFNLGRKFKVAFSSETDDLANTAVNDIGFLAKVVDGEKGFLVYSGGGLGRGPMMGDILFDFLPAKDCIKATAAMIQLFYDHGDKKNRSKARLRFVAKTLGFEEFKKLFMTYYNEIDIPNEHLIFNETDHKDTISNLTKGDLVLDNNQFNTWKKQALSPTKFEDVSSVRLFIGKGNFTQEELILLIDTVEKTGSPFIRLTPEQDLYIPFVHNSFIPELYQIININLVNQGAATLLFKDHMVTCIGGSLCSTGLLDSPVIGSSISLKLDELAAVYPQVKSVYKQLINGIRISGCGSSCTMNQIAPLGFEGMKKLIDGKLTDCLKVYVGGRVDSESRVLSRVEEDFITVAEAPDFIAKIVEEYIIKLEADDKLTFIDYMYSYKK